MPQDPKTPCWAVVLSGGQGERMRPFIQRWLGEARPKQYCAFVGTRTMLDHAIDRARGVAGDRRIVTLIGRGHQAFLTQNSAARRYGKLIEQPCDMGTAAGVFLPLAHILETDPDATVVIMPSDHYVYPERRFVALLRRARQLADRQPDQLALVGAKPTRPETEYGWMGVSAPAESSKRSRGPRALAVVEFSEKPGRAEAERLYREGGLWNTMIMAAKARTLWELGAELLPEVVQPLQEFRTLMRTCKNSFIRPVHELVALHHTYSLLRPKDFSRDLVQRATGNTIALPMEGIAWCDWGRPARVQETLAHIGARPAFPAEMANEVGPGRLLPTAARQPHVYVS